MDRNLKILESSLEPQSDTRHLFQNLENETISSFISQYQQGQRDFRSIDFNGLDLSGIDLSHADLREVNFFNCELRCANLEGADLRSTNFKNANLKAACLKNCDLSKANLTDSDLAHAILNGANLSDSIWMRVSCHRTSMMGVTLPDGSKWQFKTFLTGKNLSAEDLLLQKERSFTRRKRLAEIFVIILFILGFEAAKYSLPLALKLIGW